MREARWEVPHGPPLVLRIHVAIRGDGEQLSIDHVSNFARQLGESRGRSDVVGHHGGSRCGYIDEPSSPTATYQRSIPDMANNKVGNGRLTIGS